jgi:glycosyltransferase involved in cell wall biosynthesis
VAMIVKDESAQLVECLSGIAGFADEICLVDTGSRDNTVEIARQHKAKVTFFIWCDDFAAARNESLRKCTKDWIFVLDADERVAPEDFARLRQLVEGPANVCYRFETRNYTNTDSVAEFQRCRPDDPHRRGFAGWYPSSKVRLFPNSSGARFTGTVHELVNESLEQNGIRVVNSDIPIHHYPFMKPPSRIQA